MADLGNQKIKDTYQLVLQTDAGGNLQNLNGGAPSPFIVNGNLRYVDGGQALDYILTSDAVGNASWQTPGHSTSYWSANTSGDIFNSGLTSNVGIGTSTPNESLTVVGNISATTTIKIGSTTNYSEFSNQYIKHNGSNRIFLQSSPNISNPNILYGFWGMQDNGHFYWGTGEDLDIYHNGTNSYIDNDNGSLYVTSSVLLLGDTTSETTVQDNLTVNDDLTVGDVANRPFFYVNSISGRTGVGCLQPTHQLTVSGGTGTFKDYIMPVSSYLQLTQGTIKGVFEDGATNQQLSVGDQIRITDSEPTTYTLTISAIAGSPFEIIEFTEAYVGETMEFDAGTVLYNDGIGGGMFGVYNGSNIALQVSGSTIMSGTTDLLDMFAPYDVISGGTF